MVLINVPEKLVNHIREEVKKADYQLVDISTKGGTTFFMEVVLDKEGGITLDECSDFNRRISSWIDEQKLFESGYTLDVCSPGLDRALKSNEEFSWAQGKDIKVTTHEPVNGQNVIIGKLVEVNDEKDIVIESEKGDRVNVERSNVAKAKLYAEV